MSCSFDAELGDCSQRPVAIIDGRKRRDAGRMFCYDASMELDHDACYRALSTRDLRFDGRLFVGVLTTGIYCRPICPARTPKPQNVMFFPTAAAAQEAHFRPCLRCRPECAPDLLRWLGTSTTATRALALISEGALDSGTVDQLARRLGVGERHLRRVFRQHLGASPIAVAQTRRVLFAKQLIVDTALPLTDVALGAGFGSVRRFNATFAAVYQRPPGTLRRIPVDSSDAPPASDVVLVLPYAPPYDWDAMLDFLAARAIAGVEVVDDRRRYSRTIALDGISGWLMIEHDSSRRRLRATIRFPRVTALASIVGRIRRIFDLAADPVAIAEHLSVDPLLRPLVAAHPGLRVPGAWDGFELAVRAILGQQITVAAATKLAQKLVASYGIPCNTGRTGLTHTFPEPGTLIEANFRGLGMPQARARALSSLAAAATAEPGLFDPAGSREIALARLCALPGIGEWTAQYIAMRVLRDPDAFPAADLGLLRATAAEDRGRLSAAGLSTLAASWRPWRAYATMHLWASESATRKNSRG